MVDIKAIHEACYKAIGGEESEAVKTYHKQKNSPLTREEFFERARWGIWVGGMKVKAVETIYARAERCSYRNDWSFVAGWGQAQFDQFIDCMGSTGRGVKKWSAIRDIARRLDRLGSEAQFQAQFFGGKSTGDELTCEDVDRLLRLRLPFIGWATTHFIIRMLGGECIKDDVMVQAFRRWRGWSFEELNRAVDDAGIPRGFWDTVFWKYVQENVGAAKQVPAHFDELCARLSRS